MGGEEEVQLPEECWELIIKQLEEEESEWGEPETLKKPHLASLSLVCKRFLSITNGLLFTLHLYQSEPSAVEEILPRLLGRFRRLKRIDLVRYKGDADSILAQIAASASAGYCSELDSLRIMYASTFTGAGLQALGSSQMIRNNFKSLRCQGMRCLEDSHLNAIADSFPGLEEFDISCSEQDDSKHVSDTGILSLSLKLSHLNTINLTGFDFITDRSLEFLSTNCLFLCRLKLQHCPSISLTGISKLIHARPSLNSILLHGRFKPLLPHSPIINAPPKALSVLDIRQSVIPDEFLYQVVQARFPLEKLLLFTSTGFTFSGISSVLIQYQSSLAHLDLSYAAGFLTDADMVVLSKFLPSIKYVDLSYCRNLTSITFFSLLRNCLVLNELRMMGTNVGNENFESNCNVISGVKSLYLGRDGSVSNHFTNTLASTCPKLECLFVSHCDGVAHEGILQLLKRCSEITLLMLNFSKVMNNVFIHLEFDLPKLKELSLRSSKIDDDAAAMVGKRCPRLLKLDLYKSLSLTSKGVKAVVENCKELMEIELAACDKVNGDIIPWMVISRPSLKKIKAPRGFIPTESQNNLFLRHGCRVITYHQ